MTISESIQTCLFRKYVTFNGRASRSEYWWFSLCVIVIASALLGFAAYAIISKHPALLKFMMIALVLLDLFLFLPILAVSCRRLHDLNKPGPVLFIGCIPSILSVINLMVLGQNRAFQMVSGLLSIIIGIYFLVIFCRRGTQGPNRFGDDPLDRSPTETPAAPFAPAPQIDPQSPSLSS